MNLIEQVEVLPKNANIVVYQTDNKLVWNSKDGNDLNDEQKKYTVKSLEAGFMLKNNTIQYEINIDKSEI